MNRIFTLFLVFIYIMACNTVKSDATGQSLNRVWMLVEFNAFTKEYLVAKKAYLDLTQPDRASSKMGCNQLSFPITVSKESQIAFSNGISTKMYCDDMKLEDSFSKAITTMTKYSVDNHKLTLTSKNGVKMVFVAEDWD